MFYALGFEVWILVWKRSKDMGHIQGCSLLPYLRRQKIENQEVSISKVMAK